MLGAGTPACRCGGVRPLCLEAQPETTQPRIAQPTAASGSAAMRPTSERPNAFVILTVRNPYARSIPACFSNFRDREARCNARCRVAGNVALPLRRDCTGDRSKRNPGASTSSKSMLSCAQRPFACGVRGRSGCTKPPRVPKCHAGGVDVLRGSAPASRHGNCTERLLVVGTAG